MASISSDDTHKPLMFLGKDIKKIPCFRNSYLYGIMGGFTMGLGYFMFTSRPLRATHVGVGSFVVISSAYWILCRYSYSQSENTINEIKNIITEKKISNE